MGKFVGVGLAALVAACSSSSSGSGAPLVCKIGSLAGAWRITYAETNGSCGPVADERVVIPAGPPAQDAGPSACTRTVDTVSPDHCRFDTDYTCPLNGVPGTQHWTGTLHQTSATTLEGPWTLEATTKGTWCRSSYDVTWTQE